MTLRFRTAGAWGAGLGANLSPAQVDENFYTLQQAIDSFTAPNGVGIASITVAGTNLTVHLTDGSTQGPFAIPYTTFRDRGDWSEDTVYNPMDIFTVPDIGLYLVVLPYTSESAFDPDVMDTDGNTLLLPVISIPPMPDYTEMRIDDIADKTSYTLQPDDIGRYRRMRFDGHDTTDVTTESGVTDLTIDVPLVSTTDPEFHVGWWMAFRQSGSQQLVFTPADTGITINSPETLRTRKQGSNVTIIYLGDNEWDVLGDLEAL